jgi:DNA-binding response OmpR family regulator
MAATILVIDDDKHILDVVSRFLLLNGFEVMAAHNTEFAWDALEVCDVVLTDIQIGDENGLVFLQNLRDMGNDIPAVVMSGNATNEDQHLAQDLTGMPVFQKPLDFKALIAALGELASPKSLAG